jgi:hypothetical protein
MQTLLADTNIFARLKPNSAKNKMVNEYNQINLQTVQILAWTNIQVPANFSTRHSALSVPTFRT